VTVPPLDDLPDHVGGPGRAHPRCWDAAAGVYRHVCRQPSPRARCYVPGCTEPPGTHWGPHWCPDHDAERINRISRQLDQIRRTFDDLRPGS
jgi:hypothetical protein